MVSSVSMKGQKPLPFINNLCSCFYPKSLTVLYIHSVCFISLCIPWKSNRWLSIEGKLQNPELIFSFGWYSFGKFEASLVYKEKHHIQVKMDNIMTCKQHPQPSHLAVNLTYLCACGMALISALSWHWALCANEIELKVIVLIALELRGGLMSRVNHVKPLVWRASLLSWGTLSTDTSISKWKLLSIISYTHLCHHSSAIGEWCVNTPLIIGIIKTSRAHFLLQTSVPNSLSQIFTKKVVRDNVREAMTASDSEWDFRPICWVCCARSPFGDASLKSCARVFVALRFILRYRSPGAVFAQTSFTITDVEVSVWGSRLGSVFFPAGVRRTPCTCRGHQRALALFSYNPWPHGALALIHCPLTKPVDYWPLSLSLSLARCLHPPPAKSFYFLRDTKAIIAAALRRGVDGKGICHQGEFC